MFPEGEIRHRVPRLTDTAAELVRQGVETGVIGRLTQKQQIVLTRRYAHEGSGPIPTQEAIAADFYGPENARDKKYNVSDIERAGLRKLDRLLHKVKTPLSFP